MTTEQGGNYPAKKDAGLPAKQQYSVDCTESRVGEEFFSPMKGATLSKLSVRRYPEVDAIVLESDDGRGITFVAPKGGFVAVELYNSSKGKTNLAFRDDIRHRRINMALSGAIGGEAIYVDPNPVSGETLGLDPAAMFSEIAFEDKAQVDSIQPTWYTEDWTTIRLNNGTSIVVRADRGRFLGGIMETNDAIGTISLGQNPVPQLPSGEMPSIPAKLIQ
jgi:hypothetical protein